ncbi:MurR/RpiR family transcriptional regulator [Calderihabitans maritimus]|uniref:RpiR family transcriptional regulator n=1 Tax=Calderihabitans maritimus TaxID=1246530 RepID=A0A1Z5HQY3_9FIRM|nr:MurR/RpiR family transcriptional regulator [Calderihabitans maritimus]GAW91943.1 RpiR family transcriptional regulator [Calderihabitans maritimus]
MENEQNQDLKGCIARLRAILPYLSTAERRVAEYIMENSNDIIQLPITELAERAGVAEATIFRLCKRLGYRGYQALKIALVADLVTPIKSIHEDVENGDDMLTIASKVFDSTIQSFRDTMRLLDRDSLEKAAEAIANARRVEFYGAAGSGAVAMDCYHKFSRTGISCIALTDSHLQIMSASLLTDRDVAVGISHTGSSKDIVESLRIAKEAGATIICITSFMKSPITKVADICLFTTARETRFRSEALASRLVALAILDSLLVGVSLRRQEQALESIEKTRKAIALKRY